MKVNIIPSGQKKKNHVGSPTHGCGCPGANVNYTLFVDVYAEVMVRCFLFKSLSSQLLLLFKALKKKNGPTEKKKGGASQ